MQGLYTYCVGTKDKRWSRMKHFTLPVAGRTLDLAVVPYRDVEAVVGEVPLHEFEGTALRQHLEDEQWLKENVLAHEQIVEEVMRRTPPIVPFKFGTIFRSQKRLRHMLKAHYTRFQTLLAYFEGKQEFGVKLFSNVPVLRRSVQQDDRAYSRFAEKIQKQPPGKKYFLEKELAAKCKEKMEEKELAAAESLQVLMTPLCDQYVADKILSRRFPGRDEELIANAALFIEDTSIDTVMESLNHWNRLHGKEGVTAELSGPWPPYNFATL